MKLFWFWVVLKPFRLGARLCQYLSIDLELHWGPGILQLTRRVGVSFCLGGALLPLQNTLVWFHVRLRPSSGRVLQDSPHELIESWIRVGGGRGGLLCASWSVSSSRGSWGLWGRWSWSLARQWDVSVRVDEFWLNKLLPVRFVACIFQPVFERSTVIHKCYCSVANNVHNVFAVEQFQMFCEQGMIKSGLREICTRASRNRFRHRLGTGNGLYNHQLSDELMPLACLFTGAGTIINKIPWFLIRCILSFLRLN